MISAIRARFQLAPIALTGPASASAFPKGAACGTCRIP
jgi:hypothetical protein